MNKFPIYYQLSLFLILFSLFAFLIQSYTPQIYFNKSSSLPYYIFWSKKIGQIEKDMYVTLVHPTLNIRVGKKVAGLEGDRITISGDSIFINHTFIGKIFSSSPSGMPLQPIEPQVIPKGKVFLSATNPLSHDSRYADFGLIDLSLIEEEVCPIF